MRKADNLPPSCVVTKSGNLNFLEPSVPAQACNGTALPFFTKIELKNITSIPDSTGTLLSQNIPSILSLLSVVTIMFLSSIVILTPNGQFLDCANIAYRVLYKLPIILRDFDKIWSFSTYFYTRSPVSNFTEICSVGATLRHAARWTDAQKQRREATNSDCTNALTGIFKTDKCLQK